MSAENIARAIALAGSQQRLAELLGVRQQSISDWLRRGWMPLERARQVQEVLDGKVRSIDLVSPAILEALGVKR